jgi:hypothetical protein
MRGELRQLRVALAAVSARVDALERRRARATPPAGLLSTIAQAFGASVFTCSDLLAHTAHDAGLRALLDGASSRQVGAWLRTLHRHPGGPYALSRLGREAGGTLWALHVSGDVHTPSRPARAVSADSQS